MIKIGMTGSRRGMKDAQKKWFSNFIQAYSAPVEFHHGDCVGADEDAHNLVDIYNHAKIVIHPPTNDKLRAFCVIDEERGDEIREEKPYLERNEDIVNETDFLVAFPNRDIVHKGEGGGGTWATIRYADSVNKRVIIVYPNASVDILNDV